LNAFRACLLEKYTRWSNQIRICFTKIIKSCFAAIKTGSTFP